MGREDRDRPWAGASLIAGVLLGLRLQLRLVLLLGRGTLLAHDGRGTARLRRRLRGVVRLPLRRHVLLLLTLRVHLLGLGASRDGRRAAVLLLLGRRVLLLLRHLSVLLLDRDLLL